MNTQEKQTTTHRHRQQYGGQQKEGDSKGERGSNYIGTDEDLTLGGEHAMQYAEEVS